MFKVVLSVISKILLGNNTYLFILFSVPIYFVAICFLNAIVNNIFKIESTILRKTLLVSTITLNCILSQILIPNPFHLIYDITVASICFHIIYKTDIIKTILSTVIIFLIIIITQLLYLMFFNKIIDLKIANIEIESNLFKLGLIFSIMFSSALIYTFREKTNFCININENESRKKKLIIVIMCIIELTFLIQQLFEIKYFENELTEVFILTNIFVLILFVYINLNNIANEERIKSAVVHIQNLESYNNNLKNLYDNIRGFKHDASNIVQVIGGYIKANDMNGLNTYYNQIFKDCKEINYLEVLNPNTFNNPAIYSIVNNKVNLAKKFDIELNTHVFIDLNKLEIKIYELTRILGILLDNAIEASKECDKKIINLEFGLNKNKNIQVIRIENTYKDKKIDLDKIFEKGYSSKKGNTGLGLWKVRQILNKNCNINLFTSKDNEFFKQQIEIYL